jgi:hypothetical protein
MRRLILATGPALAALAGGCATGPLIDNPVHVTTDRNAVLPNPLVVAPDPSGPEAYATVFECVLDIIDDLFEIAYENRYDGRIETHPKTAPGLEQFFKEASPSVRERVLVTLQSYRYRASISIQPALGDGYLVSVVVFKELEDLPTPSRATAGQAAFRGDPTVERQFEVVDATVATTAWIPKGRDPALEQKLLARIQNCLCRKTE